MTAYGPTISTFVDGNSTRAVGQYARLYDHTGTQQVVADIIDSQTGEIDHEATALASDALGVGTFALTDIRDSKDYLVRRLADGNCWMVQNLDLELDDFAGHNPNNTQDSNKVLTPKNTDLADSGRSYWDPAESVQALIDTYKTDQAWIDAGLTDSFGGGYAQYVLGSYVSTDAKQFETDALHISTRYRWGSTCTAPGVCTDASKGEMNGYSYIPRSISTRIQSNTGGYNGSLGYLYAAINWKTGLINNQSTQNDEPVTYDNHGERNGQLTVNYIPTTRASSSNSIAIDPDYGYYTNADGNYYGTMYFGHLYNFYSAAAESGIIGLGLSDKHDSICPSGWMIPRAVSSGHTSYIDLTTAYDLSFDESVDSALSSRMLPLSFTVAGRNAVTTGNAVARGINGVYLVNQMSSTGSSNSYLSVAPNDISRLTISVPMGQSVRCVARGTELNSTESQQALATTCEQNKICYNKNGGSGDDMTKQSANASTSVVLTAPTYTRLGYSFAGWSTQDNGFGTVYGPNETITTPSDMSNGMTLYAKWLPSTGTMQDFTTAQCNALGTHQSVALTDNRDGNTYTVTKLKDGNCWMTTNLALNLADFAGDNPTKGYLTTANTDIGNDKDGSGNPTRTDLIDISSNNPGNSGVLRWDPALSSLKKAVGIKCPSTDLTNLKTSAALLSACPAAAEITTVDGDYAAGNYFEITSENYLGTKQHYQFQEGDVYGTVNERGQEVRYHWGSKCYSNGTTCDNNPTTNGFARIPRSYSDITTGSFYNFYAATAGATNGETGVSVIVSDSLCPLGWRLPPSSSDSIVDYSYSNLLFSPNTYNLSNNSDSSETMRAVPMLFSFEGIYNQASGEMGGRNIEGYFWSGYSVSASNGQSLRINQMEISALNGNQKAHGFSIRCVRPGN